MLCGVKKHRGGTTKALFSPDSFAEWESRFLARCEAERLAARSLKTLEQAGLGNACKRLLWEYSEGQGCFAEVQRGVALIVTNLQAFDRAWRVWKSKSNDPRAQMFRDRFEKAAKTLMETPWPFHNPAVRTFGQQFRITPSAGLFELRSIRSLVERSNLSFMLLMLRAGAAAHGVVLSGNELALLAYCANGQELDGSAVRRILREPWIAAAVPGYRAIFERSYCGTGLQQP